MKIDDILAKHPWPWCVITRPTGFWTVVDARTRFVFNCAGIAEYVRDAILELVEAHVHDLGKASNP